MDQQAVMAGLAAHSSGKSARDENFPVASLLIQPRLRPHVRAFYAFARAADDVADAPDLSPAQKLARLDEFFEGLDGRGAPEAEKLAISLCEVNVTDQYARDLLAAFRMDASKRRYADWNELTDYCRLSANPVGRYLMDLHGESTVLYPSSDALCTVLQILNHLQDCAADLRTLDRIYLPADLLQANGVEHDDLAAPFASTGLRAVIDNMLDRCDRLLQVAKTRSVPLKSRRLQAEMVTITRLAERLSHRLRHQDPLAQRIKPSRLDFARSFGRGLLAGLTRMRG